MTTPQKNNLPEITWIRGHCFDKDVPFVMYDAVGQSDDGRQWKGVWVEYDDCYDGITCIEEQKEKNKKQTYY